MFAPTRYIAWARAHHGRARFDLATSGMPTVGAADFLPLEKCPRSPAPPASIEGIDAGATWSCLREAIAAYSDVPGDEVAPAMGTTHALWLAYSSLTSPGDEIVVETPVYEPLARIAEGCGLRVIPFERPAPTFAVDPDRIARAMTPKTRAVVITNLHNPTGVRTPDDVLTRAANVAARTGAALVVDEVYAPFDDFTDARGVFARSARKLAPNVVAVSSLTKCYGIGPERIGWVLGPRDVIARCHDAIMATAILFPESHARNGHAAFLQLPRLADRARTLLAGKRERVAAWIARKGLTWSAPTSGLFAFVTLPGRGDLTSAIEAGIAAHDVLVTPGAFFGVPDAFRLGWSLASADLDEALSRLEATLSL